MAVFVVVCCCCHFVLFFCFFFLIEAFLSLKNAWLPPIFFMDTKSTAKFCILRTVLKRAKKYPCISRHNP